MPCLTHTDSHLHAHIPCPRTSDPFSHAEGSSYPKSRRALHVAGGEALKYVDFWGFFALHMYQQLQLEAEGFDLHRWLHYCNGSEERSPERDLLSDTHDTYEAWI